MEFFDFDELCDVVKNTIKIYSETLDACEFVPEKDMNSIRGKIRRITNRKYKELDWEYWWRTGKWLLLFLFCPRWKLRELRQRRKELRTTVKEAQADEVKAPQSITPASHQITVTDPPQALNSPEEENEQEEEEDEN